MNRALPRPTILAATLLTAFTLAGCGSDNDDDETGGGAGIDSGLLEGPAGSGSSPSPTNDAVPMTREIPALGTVYVERESELSLYLRPSDPPREITCLETCAQTFPPLLTELDFTGISDPFDIVTRADGENQWIYGEYPLHRYAGDTAAGDANGQGIDDAWYLARPIPISSADTAIGEVLAVSGTTVTESGNPSERNDFDGYTLYTFDGDANGEIVCTGACTDAWPPLYADLGAQPGGRYTLIERADGTRQWTYEGAPLYVYSGDGGPAVLDGAAIDGWNPVTQ